MSAGEVTFTDLLLLVIVLAFLWVSGKTAERLGCPVMVAEIVAGIAVGPNGFDIAPFPSAFVVVGQLGLFLLILEGGLNVRIDSLRTVGARALGVAISGTVLPILLTVAVFSGFHHFNYREATVAGVSLSATAIGMVTQLMVGFGLLQSRLGNLIMSAAMIDDVLSLILLAMVTAASGMGTQPAWGPVTGLWAILIPLISSVVFILITAVFAVSTPVLIMRLQTTFDSHGIHSINSWIVPTIFFVAVILVVAAHFARTTPLLGSFMAGVSFASVPSALVTFEACSAEVFSWTTRIFFASIGFAVPAHALFSTEALLYGSLLSAIAVSSKVVTGVFEWDSKWAVGWAMVGRGESLDNAELGFIMAEEAYLTGLLSELMFAAVVWALLTATLLSPIVFQWLLTRQGSWGEREIQEREIEVDIEGQRREGDGGEREGRGEEEREAKDMGETSMV